MLHIFYGLYGIKTMAGIPMEFARVIEICITRGRDAAEDQVWDEILARHVRMFSQPGRLYLPFSDEHVLWLRRRSDSNDEIDGPRAMSFNTVVHVSGSESDTVRPIDKSNVLATEFRTNSPSARRTAAATAAHCGPKAAARVAEAHPAERDPKGHSGGTKCEGTPTF
jgi:hypothetical protein